MFRQQGVDGTCTHTACKLLLFPPGFSLCFPSVLLGQGLSCSRHSEVQAVTHLICVHSTLELHRNTWPIYRKWSLIKFTLMDNLSIDSSHPGVSWGYIPPVSVPWSYVMVGIQLVRTETCSGFQSQAVTEFNYANQVQLNDSSNNRLSAKHWLFMHKPCLSWHLVVTGTRAGHS